MNKEIVTSATGGRVGWGHKADGWRRVPCQMYAFELVSDGGGQLGVGGEGGVLDQGVETEVWGRDFQSILPHHPSFLCQIYFHFPPFWGDFLVPFFSFLFYKYIKKME